MATYIDALKRDSHEETARGKTVHQGPGGAWHKSDGAASTNQVPFQNLGQLEVSLACLVLNYRIGDVG